MCNKRPACVRPHFMWIASVPLLLWTGACGENEPVDKSDQHTINPTDTSAGHTDMRDTATDDGTSSETGSSTTDVGSPTEQETGSDLGSSDIAQLCKMTPWGSSCKVGAQIYNLTFQGIDLFDNTEKEMSFEYFRCAGYHSVVMIAGDTRCTACPPWYEEIGKHIDEIHQNRGMVVVSSTDAYGTATLSNADAALETASAHPDYATGSDPFVFPCRYTFTPFTIIVDLETATILGKDTEEEMLSIADVLDLVAASKK